jgi:TonB family protein
MSTGFSEREQGSLKLGVGIHPLSRGGDQAQAWKRALGTKPIPARLSTLVETKPRWNVFGVSAAFQALLLLFFVSLPLFFPEKLKIALNYSVMPLATPETQVLLPPPPPKIKPRIERPKPEPIEQPVEPPKPKVVKLIAPKFNPPVMAKPKPAEARAPELKPAFEEVKLDVESRQPKRPREDVKLGNMTTGSAAPATVNLPLKQVQTGGFGDPQGIPGPGDPSKRANINRKGSPDLPSGPGYGNGLGGSSGVRGTVASTGFGSGIAIPPPSGSGKGGGVRVRTAGFSDATAAAAEAPQKKTRADQTPATTVVILDKPRPTYTQEGRNLKIEGDVVLDVVFLASGQLQVNRVVSGLGHGLDEAAVSAAKQIKFRPAKREGQPVDFPARVRIEFRLAY